MKITIKVETKKGRIIWKEYTTLPEVAHKILDKAVQKAEELDAINHDAFVDEAVRLFL